MIAFEISINGKIECTVGLESFGSVAAIITQVRRRQNAGAATESGGELTASVSGMNVQQPGFDEHLKWLDLPLKLGDEFTVRIVDVSRVDQPTSRHRADPKGIVRAERRYYEQLKKKYGTKTAKTKR